ncbi:MAG TPA: VOC family protein [Candidatus Lustribacter sp.]|nr:VOC family protein [Candidatus Lustribacter sp.]
MALRPNLNFAGNAGDVLAHYHAALGGELSIMRFGGSPAAEFVPADWSDKVLYGRLVTPFGEIDVMDAPPGRESPTGGNVAVAVDIDDDELGARIFAKLAEGGTVMMPFEQTFFARRFGMTSDKFGVRWMVSVAQTDVTPA